MTVAPGFSFCPAPVWSWFTPKVRTLSTPSRTSMARSNDASRHARVVGAVASRGMRDKAQRGVLWHAEVVAVPGFEPVVALPGRELEGTGVCGIHQEPGRRQSRGGRPP